MLNNKLYAQEASKTVGQRCSPITQHRLAGAFGDSDLEDGACPNGEWYMPKELALLYSFLIRHTLASAEKDTECMVAVEEDAAQRVSSRLVAYLKQGKYDEYQVEIDKLEDQIYRSPENYLKALNAF